MRCSTRGVGSDQATTNLVKLAVRVRGRRYTEPKQPRQYRLRQRPAPIATLFLFRPCGNALPASAPPRLTWRSLAAPSHGDLGLRSWRPLVRRRSYRCSEFGPANTFLTTSLQGPWRGRFGVMSQHLHRTTTSSNGAYGSVRTKAARAGRTWRRDDPEGRVLTRGEGRALRSRQYADRRHHYARFSCRSGLRATLPACTL